MAILLRKVGREADCAGLESHGKPIGWKIEFIYRGKAE